MGFLFGAKKKFVFDKEKEAVRVYKLFQSVCEGFKFKYKANDEELSVELGIQGDNALMNITLNVNKNIDVAYILSKLDFSVGEMCDDDVAQACNLVNTRLAFGSFDYNSKRNHVVFRIATNYTGMELTAESVKALLLSTYSTIDKYFKVLQQVAQGEVSFEQFQKMMEAK